jgi:hypothetical protein
MLTVMAEEDKAAEHRQCEEEEAAKATHISILQGQFEAHHTELLNTIRLQKLSKDGIRTRNTMLEAEHKQIKRIEAGKEEEETPLPPLFIPSGDEHKDEDDTATATPKMTIRVQKCKAAELIDVDKDKEDDHSEDQAERKLDEYGLYIVSGKVSFHSYHDPDAN